MNWRLNSSRIYGATFFFVCLALVVGYAIHLTYNWFLPTHDGLSLDEEKRELEIEKPSPGHVLVSSRSLVDGHGALADGRSEDHWSGKNSQEETLAKVTSSTRIVVVFVHGYNTTPEEAVKYGERLRSLVCHGDAKACPNALLYSFLWRGDLGSEEFREAQEAATTSARPFAAFISQLQDRHPEVPILVVSHSLGARVVLEGLELLREREARKWVRGVVLIQPAVRVASVSKWIKPWFLWFKSQKIGRYWEALEATDSVIATVSNGDRVLKDLFPFGKEPTIQPFSKALGSATNFADYTEETYSGNYGSSITFSDRQSPVKTFDISPFGHSEIFQNGQIQKEKLAALWNMARRLLGIPPVH